MNALYPVSFPDAPGVYQLRIRLETEQRIAVGRLGSFLFPAGTYLYTGSALGGLKGRLQRHLRPEKRLRWHIDYLLQYARVESAEFLPTEERLECEWSRRALSLPQARVIVRGFGSSDCRCVAHLVYLEETPSSDADEGGRMAKSS
jgi:Uri superfamily endonuclease